jgi:hypothetical protein
MAGQDGHIHLDVYGGSANFRVRFLVAEEDNEKNKLTFASGADPDAEDRGLLTFTNWNRKDFRAAAEPTLVAIIGGRNLYLIYAVSYDDGLYHVHLQFMEDTEEPLITDEEQANG